ncbi:MAG TPA: DUF4424 family protein [Acidobacteriaceae bacterium]|nr:DUF4424 family protein [Acidobacteriaceae bacterium]
MRPLAVLILVASLASSTALADDGAASIAAGGIVMTREPRITMAKEVLSISESKVIVDYDFRNDTDTDITTEVAFPIPDYELDMGSISPSDQGFDDFKLWVDQKPAHYTIEAKAIVKGQDYGALLRAMGVDVASFGHSKDNDTQPQIQRLSTTQKERLAKLGLIDKIDGQFAGANWKVRKKYYWSQTFPAHATVHIRHTYTPALGNSNSIAYGTLLTTGKVSKEDYELASVCPTPVLLSALRTDTQQSHHVDGIDYVDFILTTANTWKQPIEDFTLDIERPPLIRSPNFTATGVNFVSFCWDGPVEKIDSNHFRVHMTNFVPSKELRIGFLQGYK